MQILLLSLAGIALLAVTWIVAWRAGFSEGRLTVPLRLIRAIGEHRVRCEGEDAHRVVADLGYSLHLPPEEIQRLRETLPGEAAADEPTPAALRSAS